MNNTPGATRTRGIKLALLTSLAGKGVSTLVQLAALPLAIGALGQERFGVYAMLAAFLNWMSIVSVTISPGLTVQLINAHASHDRQRESSVFGSAFLFAALFAAALFAASQLLFRGVGIQVLFGNAYAAFDTELSRGLAVLSAFIAINIILSVAEAAQAGYQSLYIHNLFLAAGNILTIVTILLLVRARPTIANMIIAVYSGPLLARAASLLQLLLTRRYLITGLTRIDLPAMKLMARTGSAFMLTSLASFCYQSFSVYWVGRRMGPLAATQMSIFITVLAALGSVLQMLTQPLWPAIQDAVVRHDVAWVHRNYLRVTRYLMLYVALAALVLAVAGNQITHVWLKSSIDASRASQLLLGLYFLLLAWEQFNYSFLIGLGSFWFTSLAYFSGALLMLGNSAWLVVAFGVSGMLAAMCSGPMLVTAWLYPWKLRRLFVRLSTDHSLRI
jgi:O-antigen/teichoic acid export membrane protein